MCVSVVVVVVCVVDELVDAAGAEAEVDGVSEVTKQLEKQAIEDKEKEEEGEEGDCLTLVFSPTQCWHVTGQRYNRQLM